MLTANKISAKNLVFFIHSSSSIGNHIAIPEVADRDTDDEYRVRLTVKQAPEQGLALLFNEYYSPLCSYAIRLGCPPAAVCDLVCGVFCLFWQKEHYKK